MLLRREAARGAARPGPREAARPPPRSSCPPPAAALFERLRAWRAATAKEQGVPGLRDLPRRDAARRSRRERAGDAWPSSAAISGVGENKLAKYGQGVLEAVAGD